MIKVGGVKRKQEGSTVNRALETYVNGKAAVNNSEERAARAPKDALIRIFGVVISSKRVSLFFFGRMDGLRDRRRRDGSRNSQDAFVLEELKD